MFSFWACSPFLKRISGFLICATICPAFYGKRTLKRLTNRSQSMAFEVRIQSLNQAIRGWINYFALGSMKTAMTDIDAHLRTRLRVIIWKQWKVPKKRQWGLQKPCIGKDLARVTAYCGDRYHVQNGYNNLPQLLDNMGVQFGTYLWDLRYKGLDDYIWEYCLHKKR